MALKPRKSEYSDLEKEIEIQEFKDSITSYFSSIPDPRSDTKTIYRCTVYLANRCYKDYDEIVQACCDAWNRWIDIPSNVKNLCSRSWANL